MIFGTLRNFSEKSIPRIIEFNAVLSVVDPLKYLLCMRVDAVITLIEIWMRENFFLLLFRVKYE